MRKIELTKKEKNTLDYLLTLNKLAEQEFFTNKNMDNFKILNDLIEEKLSEIDEDIAYRMLNILYKDRIQEKAPSTEIKILNSIDVDLPKERLGILLLSIALCDKNFFENTEEFATLGFNNYKNTNMLNGFFIGYPMINYYFILDTAENFIGKISDEDSIPKEIKNDIINKFLFLYKDLYDELKTKRINQKNCNILANRYNSSKNFNPNITDKLRNILSINPFCQEAIELLKISDDTIDYNKLIIGKHYLDNILEPLTETGTKDLENKYHNLEKYINLDNHMEALNYIYDSITDKQEKFDKRKKLAKSSHNI